MRIVDSQIHLFGPHAHVSENGQVVMSAEEVVAAMDASGVERAYLVPARSDANSTCLTAAQEWPSRFRVMGILRPNRPESRRALGNWESLGYVGVRLGFPPFRHPSWLRDGTADWFWPECEARGIPVMIWAPGQLEEIAMVADRHPGLRLAVDHLDLFVDDKGEERVAQVVENLIPLARYPNVAVKASALPAHSTEPYPYRDVHSAIARVLDSFGADRVFWGTDLTRLPCTASQAVRMFTEELDFLQGRELEKVMGDAVTDWIGW
jgi:L-fuconolactonase